MNYNLLHEANETIKDKQILINMISRRTRQLSSGMRPHVEVGPRMTFADTAMAEIVAGKLVAREAIKLEE